MIIVPNKYIIYVFPLNIEINEQCDFEYLLKINFI